MKASGCEEIGKQLNETTPHYPEEYSFAPNSSQEPSPT
ncbi:hypothetical protein KKC1_29820 [Calderihabitans maritimus]|uniref:Uncharacterized protein n=1 Tax=Calderihabitans maritimus TaxID=1246530 RepID=A0A1Z5HWX1_9FIRM|nr:hypothetical protein KKC1_29820 [Calderihabitans maritimus]